MAGRNGVPSLFNAARLLCKLVYKFTPVIEQQYSGNAALLAALSAANAACAVLATELNAVRSFGD